MKFLFLALLFLAALALASGPKYNFKDPKMNDELINVYHDITAPRFAYAFDSKTLTQIKAIVPQRAGIPLYCSNCTVPVCVSTGTGVGAFTTFGSAVTACN